MPIDERELAAAMLAGRGGDHSCYTKALTGVAALARVRLRRKFGWQASDLEDVVQEVLLTVHLKKATWDETRPILPWLHAIADHKAIDAIRRRRRDGRLIADGVTLDAAAAVTAAPEPERDAVGLDLARHLDALPPRERDAVRELTVHGRSVREAAGLLGVKETALRVALHRGLKRLAAAARRDEG